jgi:hypothetical protein
MVDNVIDAIARADINPTFPYIQVQFEKHVDRFFLTLWSSSNVPTFDVLYMPYSEKESARG